MSAKVTEKTSQNSSESKARETHAQLYKIANFVVVWESEYFLCGKKVQKDLPALPPNTAVTCKECAMKMGAFKIT